jgi:hypothetical protein
MKLLELQQIIDPVQTLFNFGTMRNTRVFETVLGREINPADLQPAYLRAWRTMKVEGEMYPALAKTGNMDSVVEGTLAINLTKDDLKRIDFYEEGLYGLEILPIHTAGGLAYAQVYAFNAGVLPIGEDWDYDWYEANNTEYLTEIVEFMKEFK